MDPTQVHCSAWANPLVLAHLVQHSPSEPVILPRNETFILEQELAWFGSVQLVQIGSIPVQGVSWLVQALFTTGHFGFVAFQPVPLSTEVFHGPLASSNAFSELVQSILLLI